MVEKFRFRPIFAPIRRRMQTDRLLTQAEEWAFRLTHKDFLGLPIPEAAHEMGISKRRVQQLLASVKKKAPQLFAVSGSVPRGRMLHYDPSMDSEIKEKF